jgi:DNA-binding transcriptional MerR regulator
MQTQKKKKAGAFRTISEVAESLNIEQHVLRFWETKFNQIKPLKRGGGRRYYRPEDVAVVERIYDLLYNQKYTIKGAQNVMKGATRNKIAESANSNQKSSNAGQLCLNSEQQKLLKNTLQTLKGMRRTLEKVS